MPSCDSAERRSKDAESENSERGSMKLFEPITIRGMTLKNRIVMPPMQVSLGFRNSRAQAYFAERARGGVAAIITPATSVDSFIFDDAWGRIGGAARFINGARLLVNVVHDAGAKVGIQLWHGNYLPQGIGMMDRRGQPVAPSPREEMRELTVEEIHSIALKFALAAVGAKLAGFDFVELHGAHGYLLSQFFSPAFNRRTDEYGGSLTGRMRFALECVSTTRTAVGEDYPVFFRVGAWEDMADGIKIKEAVRFAAELEKAGVDVIDVSVGHLDEPGFGASPGPDKPMGTFAHLAEAIKKKVTVPVVAVGRINSPDIAEALLAEDKADLVAIGRQLIADPFWPNKVAAGQIEDIVPCISCNVCLDTAFAAGELKCSVNASLAKEAEYTLRPAERKKKVLVIGGGPAGMEAARTAAMRGHEVVLWEKDKELGGQLLLAAVAPHKEVISGLNKYMAGQLKKAGVQVLLGHEGTADSIKAMRPEVVVLATGSAPFVPDIPGSRRDNVVLASDVLAGKQEVGNRVVIIGGELVGCETADYLAEKGKTVTIVRRGPDMAVGVNQQARDNLLARLIRSRVTMLTGVRYEEITDKSLVITDREGRRQNIEADTVVLATGATPNSELAAGLKGLNVALHLVGDCVIPAKITEAIRDGARVGREI
jgi:2,4-dienoyl-CoA reductase-like NADH-dependent reductase (Old Yellow Enzyme family)/thioredoxin reductase